jgi:hypothetical protein
VQRQLGALADRADEEQDADERQRAEAGRFGGHCRGGIRDGAKVERAEREKYGHDAEDESPVADAVREECFLARVRGALLLVPEADEQIRAQAHAFPTDEQHQEVAAEDQHEHEEAEQVQVGEEPRVRPARLVAHVGGRVHVDQHANACDDEDHHGRQRIEPDRPGHVKLGEAAVGGLQRNPGNPVRDRDGDVPGIGRQPEQTGERPHRQPERHTHRGTRHHGRHRAAEPADPEQPVEGGSERRNQRDQPERVHVEDNS